MKNPRHFSRLRRILAAFAIALISPQLMAQVKISGLVVDQEHEPVIGATVLVKGTTIGTSTDLDGKFVLSVPKSNSILTVTYVGCKPVEIAADSPLLASGIVLHEDAEILGDLVVIGYGTVKKEDATGSVAAIRPDDFNKGNRTSVQDAMVGKIPGVNVVSSGGAPGSGATVRIRSGASLSASNDPLFVIDGVPVDNSTIEGGSNLLAGINPEDIESFTVLKDASATAIYGSRASNGVIVITTKKGSDKVKVAYSGTFALSQRTKTLDVLTADEFRQIVPGITGVPSDAVYGTANTNWQDEIFRTAFGTEQNLSVTGKIDPILTPFRVSVSYANQDGIIRNNNYQRVNAALSLTPSLLDNHLNISLNGLGYYIWKNGNSPMAIQTDNPVAMLELDDRVNKVFRSIGNAQFDYKVHRLEDLSFNLNLGYDVLNSNYDRYVPEFAGMMYTGNQKDGTGLDEAGRQQKRNYLLDFYANYKHTWADRHDFSAMAGYGWQHFWKKYNRTQNDPEGNELNTPKHYESEYYLVSFYGRVNYGFDSRFLLTATLRSDASSRFSKKNRWGLFPSVALAWRLINEPFLRDQNTLSDLKLRAGYGVTGQQDIIDDYPWMTTYSISYPESSYLFDEWYHTYRPNGYDNDIRWETTTTWNVGVDWGFINNRINGSIDYYKRFTKDLLNTINVPAGVNYAPVLTTNIGSMENQGVEIAVNAIPVTTRDWEWTIGFNYTWQQSKITKLNVIDSENNFVNTGAISGTGKTVQVFMVDKTPYTFYLAKQAYDDNGKPDGSLSGTETKYAGDKSALPTSLLGFNTRLSFRNWDLAIAGHGAFGNYVYNYVRANQYMQQAYSDQGSFSNLLKSTVETGFDNQQLYSDYWLEDGSFFRIDNITLGYTFPRLWNSSSSLRITLGVQNVCTFTKYSGVDPELYSGLDRDVYPRPRTYTLGLKLLF